MQIDTSKKHWLVKSQASACMACPVCLHASTQCNARPYQCIAADARSLIHKTMPCLVLSLSAAAAGGGVVVMV